jgi:protein-S-isoprenylcysteine O-methyltransferase Ste14
LVQQALWAALNAQPATRVVTLLFLFETASWTYVLLRPVSRGKSRIGRHRPSPWALLPSSGFLAVTSAAIFIPDVPGIAMPVSTMLGGACLFLVGWTVRYGDALADLSVPLVRRTSQKVAWLRGPARPLPPAVRHPRYLGLILEAAGLGVAASSAWALVLVGALVAVAYLAVEGQERLIIRTHPDSGWERERSHIRALCPGPTAVLQLLGPAGGLWLVTAVLAGEVHLTTAQDAVPVAQGLLTIQTILGVLPLTLAIALAQIVASTYSTRIVHVIALDRRAWLALGWVLVSLALDILILARPSLLGRYALVDLAILAAVVATLAALWATKELAGAVGPERVMRGAVDRLDSRWAAAVSEIYSPFLRGPMRVYLADPFHPVERLLARWGEEDDAGAFRAALGLLSRQVNGTLSRRQADGELECRGLTSEDEAALDTYLAYHLGPLIAGSARRRRAWVLEELLEFRWSLEPQVTRWIADPHHPGRRTGHPEDAPITLAARLARGTPACTGLYAKVLTEAIDNGLDEVGATAAYRLGGLIRRAISHLPAEESIPRVMLIRGASGGGIPDSTGGVSDPSEESRRNEEYLECLEHRLVGYVGACGAEAANLGLPRTARALAHVLCSAVKDIHARVEGVVLHRVLLQASLYSLEEIARTSAEQRLRGVAEFPSVRGSLEAGVAKDRELAEMLAYNGARVITRAAHHRVLDYGLVIDISITGLSMAQSYPGETARLILAMHRTAEALRGVIPQECYGDDIDRLAREIYIRIGQIRGSAGDARQALDKALGGMPPRDLTGEDLRRALVRAGSAEQGFVRHGRGQGRRRAAGLVKGLWRLLRLFLMGGRRGS